MTGVVDPGAGPNTLRPFTTTNKMLCENNKLMYNLVIVTSKHEELKSC